MPNENLVNFALEARDVEDPQRFTDNEWGQPEIVFGLTGGADGHYDRWMNRNGRPYEWLYMSREVARRMHSALGQFLAKDAHGA